MNKYTPVADKPLTARMIEILMDCHEKEIMKLEPCNAGTIHHASGLITRGMLSPKNYITDKGKEVIVLYVTNLGRAYLGRL